METKKYNGWTNYETWACALWIDQDSGYYEGEAQEIFENATADDTFTREERATFDLSDRLKADHEERAEEWMGDQAGVFADLLNAALSEINWHEIAKGMIEELETETA